MSPTTATTPFPPQGWVTKKTAAERLERSEEAVAGMVRTGKVQSHKAMDQTIRQLVTLIHEGDLERVIYERKHPPQAVVRGVANANNPNKPAPLALPAPKKKDEEDEELKGSRAAFMRSIEGKPWLNLVEAARYMDHPKRWLLEQAHMASKQRCIVIRDVGYGSRGGQFRFHRVSLDRAGLLDRE